MRSVLVVVLCLATGAAFAEQPMSPSLSLTPFAGKFDQKKPKPRAHRQQQKQPQSLFIFRGGKKSSIERVDPKQDNGLNIFRGK